MKTLKVKSILFSLLTVMAIAVLMTSCEQDAVVIEELEGLKSVKVDDNNGMTAEDIQPPLTLEELSAIWKEAEQIEGDNIEERSSSCKCKRVYASRRNNTSSYVYCQRWQDSGADEVIYTLKEGNTNGGFFAIESDYYAIFGKGDYNEPPLKYGTQYTLKNILICGFVSGDYTFIQGFNNGYPAPILY